MTVPPFRPPNAIAERPISTRKSMSAEQLAELEIELTQKKISDFLFSDAVLEEGKTLLDLVKDKVDQPEYLIETACDYIEARIHAWIEYLAVAQFMYMQKTGEWTKAGQDRVRLSYMRLLLSIPVDGEISYSDYSKFAEKLKQLETTYGLTDKSVEDLKTVINYPALHLLGTSFDHTDTAPINCILAAVGSPRRVMMGDSEKYKSMLFGLANTREYGSYHIHFFQREEMRTPDRVHYIVATIQGKNIAVREEVCRYVFFSKWMSVLDRGSFGMELFRLIDEENVAEAIKLATLEAFHASSREDLLSRETEFLNAMMENLVYHEVSHHVLKKNTGFTGDEKGFAEALSCHNETILGILAEVLTEWTPNKNQMKGPIRNIADVAILQNKQDKARRMLLIYMSDAWFYDTDTRFMYLYSDIMYAIFLTFVTYKEIDYLKLDQDIDCIYDYLLTVYRQLVAEAIHYVKSISFPHDGKEFTFEDMQALVNERLHHYDTVTNPGFSISEEAKPNRFWNNYFIFLKNMSAPTYQSLFEHIDAAENDLIVKIAARFVPSNERDKWGNNLRGYVVQRMKDVGFNLDTLGHTAACRFRNPDRRQRRQRRQRVGPDRQAERAEFAGYIIL